MRSAFVLVALSVWFTQTAFAQAPAGDGHERAGALELTPIITPEEAEQRLRTSIPDLVGDPVLTGRSRAVEAYQASYQFAIDEPRQSFSLSAHTDELLAWQMGDAPQSRPPDGAMSRTDYERELIERYYPIPVEQMVKVRRHSWYRRIASGVYAETQRCDIFWDGDRGRVRAFVMHNSPVTIPVQPKIAYDKAWGIACDLVKNVLRTTSVRSPTNGIFLAEHARAAYVQRDSLGVQRLDYVLWLETETEGADAGLPSHVNRRLLVSVDALTGQCHAPAQDAAYKLREHLGQLDLQVAGYSPMYSTSYPVQMLDGVPHLCWRYLDSLLWPGELQTPTDETYVVNYGGKSYTMRVDDRNLQSGDTRTILRKPPKLLGGELWLPDEVIKLITGWDVTVDAVRQVAVLSPPEDAGER